MTAAQRKARMDAITTRKDAGMKLPQIAQEIGITYEILRQWIRSQDLQAHSSKFKRPTVERPCLKCRRSFASQGAHNRLCSSCNSHSHIVSPYAPDPGGNTGRQKQAVLRSS